MCSHLTISRTVTGAICRGCNTTWDNDSIVEIAYSEGPGKNMLMALSSLGIVACDECVLRAFQMNHWARIPREGGDAPSDSEINVVVDFVTRELSQRIARGELRKFITDFVLRVGYGQDPAD